MEQLQRERLVDLAVQDGIERLVVGAIIADVDDRVLLLRRAATDTFPGLWELPSGGVDAGEGLAAAYEREVFEETGLVAEIGWYVGSFDYTTGSGLRARQFVFHCEKATGHVQLNAAEHDGFRRVGLDALPDVSREVAVMLGKWSRTEAQFGRTGRYDPPSIE
ncbi:NUDIX hydrolase [Glycomyces sp. YM15]|uniref:NUDIX hydrolase n=1 Tax=Glycomyces sp. YM15 TaxID=2800446 RepID=UPI001964100B|nr:NUDIX hydrolase [Glycomyces sp. YM15]